MDTLKARVKTGTRTTVDDYKEVEFDMDFTQIYGCFNEMAHKIKSASTFKLLFWLLAKKTNRSNGIECNLRSFTEFNNFLAEKCPECTISKQTYYKCLNELCEAGIIKKHARNNYMANIFMIWKDNKPSRIKMMNQNWVTDEDGVFINPVVVEQLTMDEDEKD